MKDFNFDLQRFEEFINEDSSVLVSDTRYDDYIKNTGSQVTIISSTGQDTISNSGSEVSIVASSGNNSISNSGNYVTISTGEGDDYIHSAQYPTKIVDISAGKGNDTIFAYGDEITVTGGEGNDKIAVNASSNNNHYFVYTYGDGNDTIHSAHAKNSTIGIISSVGYNTVAGEDNQSLSIIFDDDNSIVLKDIHGDIDDLKIVTVQSNENNLTYSGGNKTITSYASGEKINYATNFAGIGFSGNDFKINSSTGSLTIKNARDKVIDVAVNNNTVAYAYLANGGGEINGSGISKLEVIIGGNNSANTITAGSGGSSLWGGIGGNDILTGGSGSDTFFYGKSDGTEVINNASSSDVVYLYDASLADVLSADISISGSQISATFSNGNSIKINSSENLSPTFKLSSGSFKYNQSTGQWQNA